MEEYVKLVDVYKMLYDIGGCDAKDEWSKGYDSAVDNAIEELLKLNRLQIANKSSKLKEWINDR